jgi:hypothetical protein
MLDPMGHSGLCAVGLIRISVGQLTIKDLAAHTPDLNGFLADISQVAYLHYLVKNHRLWPCGIVLPTQPRVTPSRRKCSKGIETAPTKIKLTIEAADI